MKCTPSKRRIAAGVVAVLVFLAISSGAAWACSFDTDCNVGSKCLKSRGSIYGVCAGGIFPGNKYDKRPVYDPLDPNRTVGNTCSFDIDCGVGNKCLKGSGNIYGVCVR